MNFGDTKYGEVKYGEKVEDKSTLENFKPNLMKYLPTFIKESKIMTALQKDVISPELGKFNLSTHELLNQCFIETASWGLELWEEFLGIPVDKLKPYEYRRAVIKAKLRGTGTVTKAMIAQLASAYSGGEVEIIELPKECKFIIKFTGVRGIPANMMDLSRNIEEIKPAHLSFDYEYTYSVWEWYKKYTWAMLKTLTWETIKTKLNPKDSNIDYNHPIWEWSKDYNWNNIKALNWDDVKD